MSAAWFFSVNAQKASLLRARGRRAPWMRALQTLGGPLVIVPLVRLHASHWPTHVPMCAPRHKGWGKDWRSVNLSPQWDKCLQVQVPAMGHESQAPSLDARDSPLVMYRAAFNLLWWPGSGTRFPSASCEASTLQIIIFLWARINSQCTFYLMSSTLRNTVKRKEENWKSQTIIHRIWSFLLLNTCVWKSA